VAVAPESQPATTGTILHRLAAGMHENNDDQHHEGAEEILDELHGFFRLVLQLKNANGFTA
jgi:hypothetical protein